jgi:hypothetical protein
MLEEGKRELVLEPECKLRVEERFFLPEEKKEERILFQNK